MKRTRTAQFTTTAKWLHWIVAFFMISIISVALPFTFMDRADRAEAIPVHVSIGVIVVALTLVRLGWRKIAPPPAHPNDSPRWVKSGAKIGHWLLYALILWQGALGLWMAASSPVDIRFFNGFNISALAPASPEMVEMLRPWHRLGGWAFSAVLIGHVLGALWHHYLLKDDVLVRMLPFSGFWQRLSDEGRPADWRMPAQNELEWPKGKKENWLERI
jgi:cytochrome b561